MTPHQRIVVDRPARVDAALRTAFPVLSRRVARALLTDGAVRVNGRRVAKGDRLIPGDVLEVIAPTRLVAAEGQDHHLPVLVATDHWLAVDKPPGMPSHALDPRERGSAASVLLARHPELENVGDPLAPGLVHRLDTGTSGVLLVARTHATWERFRAAFRRGEVYKRYVAVVHGAPHPGTTIDVPLAHDPRDRGRMTAAPPGLRAWPAITRIISSTPISNGRSLVVLEIPTGVTHQIRAHLAMTNWPIVGDRRYGAPECEGLDPQRHALHAVRLEVPALAVAVQAPLPADLTALFAEVTRGGAGPLAS